MSAGIDAFDKSLTDAAGMACSYSRMERIFEHWVTAKDCPEKRQIWFAQLGVWWTLCDNIGAYKHVLESIFSQSTPEERRAMMDDAERAALARLPDEVEVFRGCYRVNLNGLSWSTEREVAAKFPFYMRYARKSGVGARLLRGVVRRDEIIALKLDRGENEIVSPYVRRLQSLPLSKPERVAA